MLPRIAPWWEKIVQQVPSAACPFVHCLAGPYSRSHGHDVTGGVIKLPQTAVLLLAGPGAHFSSVMFTGAAALLFCHIAVLG